MPKLAPSFRVAAEACGRELFLAEQRGEKFRHTTGSTRRGLVTIVTDAPRAIRVFGFSDGVTDAFAEEALRS